MICYWLGPYRLRILIDIIPIAWAGRYRRRNSAILHSRTRRDWWRILIISTRTRRNRWRCPVAAIVRVVLVRHVESVLIKNDNLSPTNIRLTRLLCHPTNWVILNSEDQWPHGVCNHVFAHNDSTVNSLPDWGVNHAEKISLTISCSDAYQRMLPNKTRGEEG